MNRSIKDLGKVIGKKKIYIILITIIFAITGVCYTLTNVKYVATDKILLGTSENIDLLETYKELIKSSTILEKVISNTKSDISVTNLSNLIEVSIIDHTNMIEIKVTGENPEQIQTFSNEISKVFIKTVNDIYENKDLYKVDANISYYNNGSIAIIAIITAITGFILSSLFFILCFLVDTKVKSSRDIEDITGLKSLISIPNVKMISKKKLNIKNIRAHKSEVFKTLMTNIQFLNINNLQSKSILITSSIPLEGKTYVANNLAIEFAKAGKKVIIIDADMRRGRLARIFNLPTDLGFSNYLANLDSNGNVIHERITRFIKDTEIKNLSIITSGNIPPNPTELLKTNKVEELIKDLKVFYDVIIFDGVPVLEAPEAAILSKTCDLTLLLTTYGNTKKENLAIAYQEISSTDGSVVGIAFNKIPERRWKKKLLIFKNNLKQKMNNVSKKIKSFLKKIGQVLLNIWNVVKSVFGMLVVVILNLKKLMINCVNKLKNKSQDIRKQIQSYKNKREKIKLIEAGSLNAENENIDANNMIQEVFDDEIAKLESNTEPSHEVEFKKKLDELKNNIDEKVKNNSEVSSEEKPKVRVSSAKLNNQIKSKFDLMLQQQEMEQSQLKYDEVKLGENYQLEIDKNEFKKQQEIEKIEKEKQEEIKARQKMEKERKEEQKRIRQEKIANYEEIDFTKQEFLTEEMIRRQVEMDDMIRLAEIEEKEEKARLQQMKQKEKSIKRQERREKFQNFIDRIKNKKIEKDIKNAEKQAVLEEERFRKNEAKMEEKIKKEAEKNESKARIAKVKEEKRAYKEMEKQKHKEELRIKGELQEDNLYPKPRM